MSLWKANDTKMTESDTSSSVSDAGADMLESILGFGGGRASAPATPAPSQRNPRLKPSSKKLTDSLSSDQSKMEGAADSEVCNGLELELKGLPLRVDPQRCSEKDSDRLILQPHQKVLRLLIDGDPDANPAGQCEGCEH